MTFTVKKVLYNKSSDVKYVVLPKDSDFEVGEYVKIVSMLEGEQEND